MRAEGDAAVSFPTGELLHSQNLVLFISLSPRLIQCQTYSVMG